MAQVIKAVDEGRMIEMFGSGTAAIVTPVKCIGFEGRDVEIPVSLGKYFFFRSRNFQSFFFFRFAV